MVLYPDGILFERAIRLEVIMIMVILDAGNVGMSERRSAGVVLQSVCGIGCWYKIIAHRGLSIPATLAFRYTEQLSYMQNTLTSGRSSVNVTLHNIAKLSGRPGIPGGGRS
jgi:hypothetical protein